MMNYTWRKIPPLEFRMEGSILLGEELEREVALQWETPLKHVYCIT